MSHLFNILMAVLLVLPGALLAIEKEPLKEEPAVFREKLPLIIDEPSPSISPPEIAYSKVEESSISRIDPSQKPQKVAHPKTGQEVASSKEEATGKSPSVTPPDVKKKPQVSTSQGSARKRLKRRPHLGSGGEEMTTVGEMVASFLPDVLKDEENPSLGIPEDEEVRDGVGSLYPSEEPGLAAIPTPGTEVDRGASVTINLIMTGIGLAGLLALGGGLLIRHLRPRKREDASPAKPRENAQIEDPRSDIIYKGWWQDDIRDLQRTYRKTIKDLDERVETKIMTIEDNQTRLSHAFTEIEEKLERVNSLISRGLSRSRGTRDRPNPYERVVQLSKSGLSLEEIARTTRMGRGEVELILKSQERV